MSVVVRIRDGDCPCPGTPHDHEEVHLEPELTLPMAHGAMALVATASADSAATMAALSAGFLPAGIRSWTFTDEDGPVPVSRENMERLMPWDKGGYEVNEQADALYSERLFAPLAKRLSASVPDGQTERPMSPIPLTGRRPPKSSPPSSPDGSDMPRSAAAGR